MFHEELQMFVVKCKHKEQNTRIQKWVYKVKICKPKNHNWLQRKKMKAMNAIVKSTQQWRTIWISWCERVRRRDKMYYVNESEYLICCYFCCYRWNDVEKKNIGKEMKVSIGINIYIRMTCNDFTLKTINHLYNTDSNAFMDWHWRGDGNER